MTRWLQVGMAVGLFGAGVVLAPPPATAAGPFVFTVTTSDDVVDAGDGVLSLREAVDLANAAGGTASDPGILIQLGVSPVTLTRCDGTRASEDDTNDQGDLDYTGARGLAIRGPDPADKSQIVQTCTAASGERVLDVDGDLHIENVWVSGGDAAGDGGGLRSGTVWAEDVEVRGNRSAGSGGGIAVTSSARLSGGAVWANAATGDGGGVWAGGEVLGTTEGYFGHPTGVGSNDAGGDGGGLAAASLAGTVNLETNHADGDGGGAFVTSVSGDAYGPALRISGNTASGRGGGIRALGGVLSGARLADNEADGDGGGAWMGGAGTLEWVEATGNRSTSGDGGGVFVDGAGSVMTSLVADNSAPAGSGGGVFLHGGVVDRVRVVDNAASAGAGVAIDGSVASQITSTLVAGNQATTVGGGVRVDGAGSTHLVHLSTLVGNGAGAAANLSVSPSADVRVAGTVLASPGGGGANCTSGVALGAPGPSAPAGAKGRQPSYSTDTSCPLQAVGSTIGGVDPGLDPVTFEPQWDSPLRGAVQLPPGTQAPALFEWVELGEWAVIPLPSPRPIGAAADIGAFEGGEPLVHAVAPQRVLDTRKPSPVPLGAGGERVVQISGLAGVPAGATGVVANVTVVDPTAATHLTVWPGGPRPSVSNVNAPAGVTVASSAVVRLSDTGSIRVRNNAGTAHVLVDVVGWVDGGTDTTGWAVTPVAPTRVINTRSGAPFSAGQVRTFDVDGGVVPAGAEAVVVNVTGVEASVATHLTAWEAGTTAPATSTVNLAAGATVANLAVVPLDAQGRLSIRNNAGSVHVLGDVVAYLDEVAPASSTDGGLFSLVPRRAFDSRSPGSGGPFTGGVTRTVDLATAGGPVPAHARAAVVTLTVVGPSATTHLTAWASGAPRPATSNVNVPAGVTRANTAVVPLDGDGEIDLRIASGTAHVIVDVVGYLP